MAILDFLSEVPASERPDRFGEFLANDLQEPPPPTAKKKRRSVSENFRKNIGGWQGVGNIVGRLSGNLAIALAEPHYNTGAAIGKGLGRTGLELEGLLGRQRDRVDDEELEAWIAERLADPSLPADERKLLESYEKGGTPLAQLQLYLDKNRRAGQGGLTATQDLRNRQAMNRWETIAGGGIAQFDLTTRDTEGSLLNDALKQFYGESDAAYRQRLEFVRDKSSLLGSQEEGAPGPLQRETFGDWMQRHNGALGAGGADGGPAGPLVDQASGIALDPIEGASSQLLNDLYAEAGIARQPSSDPFVERVFGGTPVGEGLEAGGASAIAEGQAYADIGRSVYDFFGGNKTRTEWEGDPNLKNTVRRQEQLSGNGIVSRLAEQTGVGTGPASAGSQAGTNARGALMRGLSSGGEALRKAPDNFMTAIEKLLRQR